jgi:hypothetical protein
LGDHRTEISVVVRPMVSQAPSGTTLRVELLAERRGSELRADVTGEQESVHARVWVDGIEVLDRHFQAPRRTDVDLLAESIEAGGREPVTDGCIRMAAALAGADVDTDTHPGTAEPQQPRRMPDRDHEHARGPVATRPEPAT